MRYNVIRHTIRSTEDFSNLKTAWEALETGNEMTAFQTYFWNALLLEQWLRSQLRRSQSSVEIYIACHDEQPVMILPLLIVRFSLHIKEIGWHRGIYLLGTDSVSDYLNAIYNAFDAGALEALLKSLRRDHPALDIRFDLIREDTSLHRYLSGCGFAGTECAVFADIPVPESGEAYEKLLSKSTRQNLRTAANRADRDGINYQTELLLGTLPPSIAARLNKLHAKRVETIRAKALPNHVIKRAYRKLYHWTLRRREQRYPIVMESMIRNPHSVVFIVRLREQLAGYLYGTADSQSVRIIHNCFDEEFRWYSPLSRGCHDFILGECETRQLGVSSIDFTRGDETYKLKLGCTAHKLYSYSL